jgi:hypothetical protein
MRGIALNLFGVLKVYSMWLIISQNKDTLNSIKIHRPPGKQGFPNKTKQSGIKIAENAHALSYIYIQ